MGFVRQGLATTLLAVSLGAISLIAQDAIPMDQRVPPGDSPADPGPLAADLSPALKSADIKAAVKRVADWQLARVANTPSQDWTYATLYAGFIAASETLKDDRYSKAVEGIADHYHWTLGPRQQHADDQAIGQSYLALYRQHKDAARITPMRDQFDRVLLLPDDPKKPVWWWCDALFMAPPVWAGMSKTTGDPKYRQYMDREWEITADLLWDKEEHLFFRDATYFDKREKNGKKIFWSRGNGWVMGGIVRTLDELPAKDPKRAYYLSKFKDMSEKIATLQGEDGLWRPGLLDAEHYPLPEDSGSAFFVYAMAWGINHHVLDEAKYGPIVAKAWKGLISHIYQDGRLGAIQPVGAAPGAFIASSSYVFGTGAFMMAGSELDIMSRRHIKK
ncbi:glycoside hydrolase family 88 protein [Granulicella sp. dw_53]|uniref:glycoside hydrolase family 88/105 protein n=1 Tax=Granulicella sp. dw_53 TaxID=2719792 RepID=UPI001BD42B3E|nr:glycoside hydrolase family 88 protein [Granulicella sp. dw_53]